MANRIRSLLRPAAAAAILAAGGCGSDPLFPTDQDRTPFDRYDAVRNQDEPAESTDQFGRRQPNLRGRLSRR